MQLSDVRPSVRLSVCLSVCLSNPAAARRCYEFAAVGPAGRRYRSIAAAAAGDCGQCHVVSVVVPYIARRTCAAGTLPGCASGSCNAGQVWQQTTASL